MNELESLCHAKWDCKYHLVFIPKCRRKVLYGELRANLGDVFRELARQRESRIEEGHLMADHVHMLIAIPPKYAVAQVVSATSKAKVRFILPARLWGRSETLSVSTSGREATSCRP